MAPGNAAGNAQANDEEWRVVPGIDATELLVSSEGRVRTKGRRSTLGPPYRGCLNAQGYYVIQVQKKRFQTHQLVCWAFHGPKPTPEHTPNHKNHNRSDNRACNLEWASKREQAIDQRKAKPKATGKPVFSKRFGSDDEWVEHASATAAGIALNVHSAHVAHVANGTGKQAGGYVFKWAAPRETQEDLPAEGTKPREEWKFASPWLKVSNRGRVQAKASSTTWGHKRKPTPVQGHVYPVVMHLGKHAYVHQLCYKLFGARPLKPGETIDHWDQDKTNNSIDNLRPATSSDQRLNQTLKPRAERGLSTKNPVRCKPVYGLLHWEIFPSQKEAADVLNARYPDKKFHAGNISRTARGLTKHHAGWLFEYVV